MLAIYGKCMSPVPQIQPDAKAPNATVFAYGHHRPSFDYLHKRSVDSHSMGKPSDLVQGTLDLLILKTVSLEPQHGWAIAKRIQQISNEVLQVQQGSLYPALHRLEQQGWIRAKWAEADSGRQAKFYSLTTAGRTQLEREKESWSRLSTAINLVVEGV
jgi:PadR family transcriptional regulator PadR